MPAIKIKPFFGGWKEVDFETARNWATHLYQRITMMPTKEERASYIDQRLSGTTCEQLGIVNGRK